MSHSSIVAEQQHRTSIWWPGEDPINFIAVELTECKSVNWFLLVVGASQCCGGAGE